MKDRIMQGLCKYMLGVPSCIMDLKKQLMHAKKRYDASMGFMTDDHRRVHYFAVKELPRHGKPLSPGFIAGNLGLPVDCVVAVLVDLEEHMTIIFRNREGAVAWACTVTVYKTPHHLTFSTGEEVYAA